MKVFVDTNVFLAALTDEPERGDKAVEFLNADFEFYTSILNLMELRAVLAKKKRIELGPRGGTRRSRVTPVCFGVG
ncbi:MAG: type II toxin-antitoxin system VapC family toxin [Halobacteriota archaeon]